MTFELFAFFRCDVHCCAHENEIYHFMYMYVFLSTLKALEIEFLHFYYVLNNTQEYSWVLLWSTQDLLEYIHKMSTQYLLEYFSNCQYSVLTRVVILSTRSMPGIYATYPIHVTSAYIPVSTLHYLLLHTQPAFPYPILGRNDPGPKQLWPKRPRPKWLRAEMTQGRNERPENVVAVVEQERTCRVVHLIIWLSIFFGCECSGLLIYLL